MNKEGLEAIYQSIAKTSIKEITIETTKGTEVKIVRSKEEMLSHKTTAVKNDSTKNTVTNLNSDPKTTSSKNQTDDLDNNKQDVLSPQVGFFNRYNPRSKKQYVKLRDEVTKGTVIASVISMHLPHDVVADRDGKIVEFLVENDQPVEYNQPLIRIETK